jgi:hypothetical protein
MTRPLAKLIPVAYTHILGRALFLYFGVKLVLDSCGMEASRVSEELEKVEEELLHPKKADLDLEEASSKQSDPNSIKTILKWPCKPFRSRFWPNGEIDHKLRRL